MFVTFRDWTGIELINHWYVLLVIYPTLTVAVLHLDHDRLFRIDPKELDEAAIIDGASWFQTLTRIFIPVALPGIIASYHLRLHRVLGAIPLSAGVHDLDRSAGAAGRHHHHPDQGRRLQLGPRS